MSRCVRRPVRLVTARRTGGRRVEKWMRWRSAWRTIFWRRRSPWLGDDAMRSAGAKAFPGLTGRYASILIDPPWRFANRTGKMAPEHKRLHRYPTMSFDEIAALPV